MLEREGAEEGRAHRRRRQRRVHNRSERVDKRGPIRVEALRTQNE
jgi:hypothetical protein